MDKSNLITEHDEGETKEERTGKDSSPEKEVRQVRKKKEEVSIIGRKAEGFMATMLSFIV